MGSLIKSDCEREQDPVDGMPKVDEPGPNSIGWHILEGYPWWPVFVCDPKTLREDLHLLGNGHRKILKKARDFPKDFGLVYYFGSHDFSQTKVNRGTLRHWDCDQKEEMLKGMPKHLVKRTNSTKLLKNAIQEAEDYLAEPEDTRVPSCMVPSDLDPSLESPPVEDEDEDEDMEDGGDASEEEAAEPAEPVEEEETAPKKRKKSSTPSPKPSKKAKKEESQSATTDKSEKSPKAVVKKEEPKDEERSQKSKSGKKTPDVSEEKLRAMLEEEIRWILLNSEFNEMTTKSVRKMLEKRLSLDLRHHKKQIKEGVAQVISSMEEEEEPNGKSDVKEEESSTLEAKQETKVETDDIKRWREQLEAKETSHEDIMEILQRLQSLPLQTSDLKNTGISRAVADLRQHENDRVSATARDLRKTWMQQLKGDKKEEDGRSAEIERIKDMLANVEQDASVLKKTLEQLDELDLTTKEIIDSQIGKLVSKLRKAKDESVAYAAAQLRRKWKERADTTNAQVKAE